VAQNRRKSDMPVHQLLHGGGKGGYGGGGRGPQWPKSKSKSKIEQLLMTAQVAEQMRGF